MKACQTYFLNLSYCVNKTYPITHLNANFKEYRSRIRKRSFCLRMVGKISFTRKHKIKSWVQFSKEMRIILLQSVMADFGKILPLAHKDTKSDSMVLYLIITNNWLILTAFIVNAIWMPFERINVVYCQYCICYHWVLLWEDNFMILWNQFLQI